MERLGLLELLQVLLLMYKHLIQLAHGLNLLVVRLWLLSKHGVGVAEVVVLNMLLGQREAVEAAIAQLPFQSLTLLQPLQPP
jgi:hypothetical protein